MSNTFYNEILTDHNVHPVHKHDIEGANLTLEGVNPSCGDDIILKLKVEDGVIVDGGYEGDGCAISQASCDMMLDLIIGREKEEALRLSDIFLRMIKDKITSKWVSRTVSKSFGWIPFSASCSVMTLYILGK